ncbi:MAG: NAD(P)/FAD-dependent oxidoreductase [Flavobacteriales bacterium]|nr:NAD(P)/FAD-dependent oxidoreductase [Flavobacteriales bacterium]
MLIPDSSLPRVVIIGGGFGGINLAKKLDTTEFQVVLLDKHNYHTFQPLLYQVATAGIEPGSIAYPFRKVFAGKPNFFFRMAEVQEVRAAQNEVVTNIGALRYDYLVIATGAKTNFFGLKNLEANAMAMKTVSEALDIRSLLIQNFEKALLTDNLREREALMSVVIVGGGPTGVELAGALSELKKDILPKDYPDLDVRVMDIHLIDSNARVLKEMTEKSSAKALTYLRNMGIHVWLNVRVTDFNGAQVNCNNGQSLNAATVIWAAGVTGAIPAGLTQDPPSPGRLTVDEAGRVKGFINVFAIGDVAKMESAALPHGHPMMAQPAMQQGVWLASNLLRLKKGTSTVPFVYKNLGSMATVGRNKAVTELPSMKLYGWLAWAAWLFVHVYQLIGFRNKVVVLWNWMHNYLRHSRDLRLIIRPFKRTNPQNTGANG